MTTLAADLTHALAALHDAMAVLRRHAAGASHYEMKPDGPVTAADREVDALLRQRLPRAGEGWLSEESIDDHARLACARVWIVDPLDGTRAFVARRPEYSTSIALVENGQPVLGVVGNPATGVVVAGGLGLPVSVEGETALPWPRPRDQALSVLCSRSEWRRGEWRQWERHPALQLLPCGSVAYKLALVAAGAADATWTFCGKSEWDVAAGAALLAATGGAFWLPSGQALRWNQPRPVFPGMIAAGTGLPERVARLLANGTG
ncbi:MAG: 3'(2'),5'-bisphosphate nucleotidase CysQ [Planctomycetes bacterium]|nr:3'(2'),5'-bisphosphate nucleotidase CysQ [Planctomycetota bacterium]